MERWTEKVTYKVGALPKKCLEILSFYTYMCIINENHMMYGSWNKRSNRQKFSTFWAIFWPFRPLTTWKMKILTLKKAPGDIIILHICTINDNHMIYDSWDMELYIIFCYSGPFIALLPHYGPRKSKFSKKMKKTPEDIIILQTEMTIIWCMVSQIWSAMDRTFCHFGLFLPFHPLTTQNFKILKKWNNLLQILSFYTSVP